MSQLDTDTLILRAGQVLAQPACLPAMGPASLSWRGGRLTAVQPQAASTQSGSGSNPGAGSAGASGVFRDAPEQAAPQPAPSQPVRELTLALPERDRIVLPALANAHDHARNLRSATLGAAGQPLESWLPFLGVIPGADPYLAAATSFCRSVRGGATAVMVHYTRVQGGLDYVQEALAVARAARDVGIRIGFAPALRDRHGIAYCDDKTVLAALRPGIRESVKARLATPAVAPASQIERVRAVAQAIAGDSSLANHVTVQYGPTGVQWCSHELLCAIAQASAEDNRPVHMHLLETRYQRQWADQAHPDGVVRYLDAIGLLSPRLTLAHCAWARPDELALLARRGVTIAVNASSNLQLRSGIAPVAAMHEAGCRVAMGLDGLALDEDDDALREMRLNAFLHRGWGYEDRIDEAAWWRFAAVHGRLSILGAAGDESLPAGVLQAGAAADFMVLDRRRLDEEGALVPGVDPWALVLARGCARHIDSVVAQGRCVVQDGRVTGVDEAMLVAQFREQVRAGLAAQGGWAQWGADVRALAEDLGPFYRKGAWLGCC